MIYRTRDGNEVSGNGGQDRLLSDLYGTFPGRIAVRLLIPPVVSKIGGFFLNSALSRFLIRPFVRKNNIDLNLYEPAAFAKNIHNIASIRSSRRTDRFQRNYRSYNEFFTRKIKDGLRPFDSNPSHLVSPCDGKLTVCPISKTGTLYVKQTAYTIESLLRNRKLADRYDGGQALIFRLTVDDYHRYFYVDDGKKSRDHKIPGVLHTVNPVAGDVYPIYKENSRQYCLIKTSCFGTILMMEVGALMVGKIHNHHSGKTLVNRGMEKGYFEFGGSTILLLLQSGAAILDADLLANSREGIETIVKAGERIGKSQKVFSSDDADSID
ncbi:MAG: phosphatidylserine decarboxylase [Lachnospiraceae bacterium]|nr:phosphatidylserine decarboxylase [Lachnospiraceae bacterium]